MKPVELDLDKIPHRARKPAAPPKKTRPPADWRRVIHTLRYEGPMTIAALWKYFHGTSRSITEPRIRGIPNAFQSHGLMGFEALGRLVVVRRGSHSRISVSSLSHAVGFFGLGGGGFRGFGLP